MTGMDVRDAVEAPLWSATMGPPPRMHVWKYGCEPLMRIRVAGVWRRATVGARATWADGRVSYQVTINLPYPDGSPRNYLRHYWWDPKAMRPRNRCLRSAA